MQPTRGNYPSETYLEGDILELIDGTLWIVKGCIHPNAPVAVPRLVGSKKVKRVREAFEIITRYYPFFLKYVPELGRKAPLVSASWIRNVRKFLYFSEVSSDDQCLRDEVASVVAELIKLLQEECGLRCGPTGSVLGGYAGDKSDIDINCLEEGGSSTLECLLNLRSNGLLKQLPFREFIKELPLVSEALSYDYMNKLVIRRVTQGIFKGVKYTLRIIDCSRIHKFLGPYTHVMQNTLIVFEVVDSDYRTPSIYNVKLYCPKLLPSRKAYFVTHRVRFTEIPPGSLIFAKGDVLLKDYDTAVVSLDTQNSKVEAVLLPPHHYQ